MNPTQPLTDAEIEARLVQSFAAHEPLVDADRATELMRTAYATPRTAGSHVRWAAAAAAVAILAGGAYAVRSATVDDSPGRGAGAPTSVPSSTSPSAGPHADPGTRPEAEAAVARSWSVVPLLPGAQRAATAPDPSLAEQTLFIGGNAAHEVRWWVAPGTVAAALAELRAHPPAGFNPLAGGGDVIDVHMRKLGEEVTWDADPSGGVGQATVDISVVTHGAGVAVRVDSLAKYRPARPADLWIDPATVTGAHVEFVSHGATGGQTSRSAELNAQQARAVVDLVNAQPTSFDMGDHSCPISVGPARDEVTLRTRTKPVVVTVGLACPGGVRVGLNTPTSWVNLTGQADVDAALRRAGRGD